MDGQLPSGQLMKRPLATHQGRAACRCHSVNGYGCSNGLNTVSPHAPLEAQNMTLFGNRVFADVIQLS